MAAPFGRAAHHADRTGFFADCALKRLAVPLHDGGFDGALRGRALQHLEHGIAQPGVKQFDLDELSVARGIKLAAHRRIDADAGAVIGKGQFAPVLAHVGDAMVLVHGVIDRGRDILRLAATKLPDIA